MADLQNGLENLMCMVAGLYLRLTPASYLIGIEAMTSSAKQHKQNKPNRDDAEQSRLFIEKAREIGADEEKSRADELIGRLAKKPPEPHPRIKKSGTDD